jgi:hypothetical protein
LLGNEAELRRLSEGAAKRARPHAAAEIAQHILNVVDRA